jgi:8-oxo-dGTP pyrophosphatase MutT (NUDIX family)
MSISKMQYAALPYRRRTDDLFEIMLVTSRETGRWVIPKGWPISGLTPQDSAAREAIEEAGVLGQIGDQPIGTYHYDKRLPDGSSMRCAVEVFLLKVEQQLASWPEQAQRQTRWFSVLDAAGAVHEPELSIIISSARTI